MKLENQTINIKIAKRLYELGSTWDSRFRWEPLRVNDKTKEIIEWCITSDFREIDGIEGVWGIQYPAYSVAELGEILLNFPYQCRFETEFLDKGKVAFDLKFSVVSEYRIVRERKNLYDKITDYQYHLFDNYGKNYPKTEADARGMFLIFLLENKVILPDKKG